MGLKEMAMLRNHKRMSEERRERLKVLVMTKQLLTVEQGLELIEALEWEEKSRIRRIKELDYALDFICAQGLKDEYENEDEDDDDDEYPDEALMSATSVREINSEGGW